jgi:3-keto-5-aminohexanoate cleavage enzyme
MDRGMSATDIIRGHTWQYSDTRQWMSRARDGFGPLMISCAVNGGVQGRESNESLPETPEAIAEQVAEAHAAGAVIVHVHPRDRSNLADTARTADEFHEVNAEIRAACPTIVINNTTGASISPGGETYFEILDALPEMASLNMGPEMTRLRLPERPEHLPNPRASALADECLPWTYGRLEELAARMQTRQIKPELETYHPGQYWVTAALIDAGLLTPPYVHQFVMGYQTSIYPSPANLCAMFADLPSESIAFVAGIGQYQLPMNALAIVHGAHVRVGLEDNVYYRRGQKLSGNGEAVRRITRLADELQRPVATVAEARALLGLSAEPRTYPS